MISRTDKVKAGIFVIVSVVLLAATVFLIAGMRVFKSTRTYYVLFRESVTGLEESSVVRFSGVPVGHVSDISFAKGDPSQILVAIEIDPETPMRADTMAELKPKGITGVYYIDLSGGATGQQILPEGSRIEAKTSVTAELLEMLADIKSVVVNLNDLILENRDSISQAVTRIEEAATAAQTPIRRLDETLISAQDLLEALKSEMTGTISLAKEAIGSARTSLLAIEAVAASPELAALPGKLNEVLDTAVTALNNANDLMVETKSSVAAANLDRVIDALEKTLLQLSETGRAVARTVDQVQMGVRENRGTLLRIASDFRTFSSTLKVLADEIREDPSRLLFGRRPSTRKEGR